MKIKKIYNQRQPVATKTATKMPPKQDKAATMPLKQDEALGGEAAA